MNAVGLQVDAQLLAAAVEHVDDLAPPGRHDFPAGAEMAVADAGGGRPRGRIAGRERLFRRLLDAVGAQWLVPDVPRLPVLPSHRRLPFRKNPPRALRAPPPRTSKPGRRDR